MRKQRLKKPVTLAGQSPFYTTDKSIKNDHRTKDILAHSMLAPIEVDNPEGEGKILVMRNLRCDPLSWLHSHGRIDEAQFAAGDLWRDYWAEIEVGGARAIDPSKEAVDGGGFIGRDSDRYNKAFTEIGKAAKACGMLGEQALKDVLGARLFIGQYAAIRGISPEEGSAMFKRSLEKLAALWGFAMRGTTTSEQGART